MVLVWCALPRLPTRPQRWYQPFMLDRQEVIPLQHLVQWQCESLAHAERIAAGQAPALAV